jgi:hypothetical protein
MDVAATRWMATCSAAAATCGAWGLAHFPRLLCTSLSSEQGPGGRGCGREVSRLCFPPSPPTKLLSCPQGPDPRVKATPIYSPSVPPQAASLPLRGASPALGPRTPAPCSLRAGLGVTGLERKGRLPWPGPGGSHFPWFGRGLGSGPSALLGAGVGGERTGLRVS